MAAVDRWRQPLSNWRRQFSSWIREPTKEAVMHSSIFFDMRAIHGDASLVSELEDHVIGEVATQSLFMAHLARNSMERTPPLGFFGQLVVEHSGEHGSTLDLKHRGLIPIVDLARVYGLEAGCKRANTLSRLRHASERGALSESGCAELTDAYEYIAGVRLRQHARWLTQGKSVSNHLDPSELSSAERSHLRDAFSVVRTLQRGMEASRQLAMIGG